ncbi:hypothetical protein CCHR01_04388 [Colletotrichum chrysophilum]|uniref:Uncharacterized protein n=1 Tax=Colletotrichum chrysophilum TaxID=1836956 RepID=A0AAD9ARW7_9PEZI|nr:hypothetical protein CCHR01_04388 [Colletotrichum chrysophilum]
MMPSWDTRRPWDQVPVRLGGEEEEEEEEARSEAGEKGTRGERKTTFPESKEQSRAAEVERRREVTGKKAEVGSQLHLTSVDDDSIPVDASSMGKESTEHLTDSPRLEIGTWTGKQAQNGKDVEAVDGRPGE